MLARLLDLSGIVYNAKNGSVVNHPHLIGVGMSREGYGQQVDKEA